jgi:hypothetical protein
VPVVVGGILRIFWLIRNIVVLTISAVPVFAVFKFSIRIIEKTEHSPGSATIRFLARTRHRFFHSRDYGVFEALQFFPSKANPESF